LPQWSDLGCDLYAIDAGPMMAAVHEALTRTRCCIATSTM
jgi:hypothetical protein